MIAVVVAPGAGLGGVVEDRLAALCGADHGAAIGQVAAQLAYAELVEHRVQAAVEAHHFMPALHQAAAQRAAEEAAATGDEDLHRLLLGCFAATRSEEHTSELQSLMRSSYAVLCL